MREEKYGNPYDAIFEASLKSVKELGWKLTFSDSKVGDIKAQTGSTLWSWGEDISIKVSKEAAGSSVSVFSKASSQLFDWGKSEENEKLFHIKLKEIISR